MTDLLIAASGPAIFVIFSYITLLALRDLRAERKEQLAKARRGDPYILPRARRTALIALLWLTCVALAVSSFTVWLPLVTLDVQRVVTGVVRLVLVIVGTAILWSWLRD